MIRLGLVLILTSTFLAPLSRDAIGGPGKDRFEPLVATSIISLDSGPWRLATDRQNVGRSQRWWRGARPDAKSVKVPWIIQDAFPGYHGVVWYWRPFTAPANPRPDGRYVLRFWAVDYLAEVWLNGSKVGGHEGGETPFELDVTDAIRPGKNLLAVRVLNPTNTPIDGIVLAETPHRNKVVSYGAGSSFDHGGIVDTVELLVTGAVRVTHLFARPDPATGTIQIEVAVANARSEPVPSRLELTVAPARGGATVDTNVLLPRLSPGTTVVKTRLHVKHPHRWELNDPYLYRVTAHVQAGKSPSFDEFSTRCGFRTFRFANGYFRLNGRRLFLRCSHTGNHCPIGLEWPHDPDLLRRDLLNAKTMRFNAIRFIAGVAKRYQLDLCDEIGLLVYEESYASWCLADSPKMCRRYDESVLGMIRRDRNHPSIVMWGLLNETQDGPVFRHAVATLPAVRALDDSRMVMLNSGRFDRHRGGVPGIDLWRSPARDNPCVTFNPTQRPIRALGITWTPGQLALHPGPHGEYAVVRWTAGSSGQVGLTATFTSIAERATTDVHVLHNGRSLFDSLVNLQGRGRRAHFATKLHVEAGDTIDCVVGFGNGNYGADTTALAATVRWATGRTDDAARDFSIRGNPSGPWTYGQLKAGSTPKMGTFVRFTARVTGTSIGGLSNPGSRVWENVLDDRHPYPRVPHTAATIRYLRTLDGGGLPLFVSEYGIGSAVDLPRVVRLYEQLGKATVEDATFYARLRDRFLADWRQWKLSEVFDRPEDLFARSIARMAGQRRLGINALRANPHVVGYSLTGTVDQGMTGEGLWTTFRELKPGTADAVFDGFAPLRWCLFAEPVNVYRKTPVRLEAVLANEDALLPGDYPVCLQVVGPAATRVFEKTITVTIPPRKHGAEPPFAQPVFAQDVVIDGPPGRYRFLATFRRGAAAAGGRQEFYVDDPATMPPVEMDVALWGEDKQLAGWLARRGVRVRPFSAGPAKAGEVILAARKPPAPGGAVAFQALARRVDRGATVVFLCPEIFRDGKDPTGFLPLSHKGTLQRVWSWLYLKDDWAKPHAIFAGLPTGLLDFTFYREIIPDQVWVGQDPPLVAVAGGIKASQDYSSGLTVAVYKRGRGRMVLNTLRIRANIGHHPAAERLLRNMLRYAAHN